ncbi:hypothetical protein DL96DRAFT_1821834 [Flagelloscypha sp. PMI_526]|nr:hypothetical protein DL96DRAFT_1821834 [Flagelloscypha sp. PMI_526]
MSLGPAYVQLHAMAARAVVIPGTADMYFRVKREEDQSSNPEETSLDTFENPGNLADSILSGSSDSSTISNEDEQVDPDSNDDSNDDQGEITPENEDSPVSQPQPSPFVPHPKTCPGCSARPLQIPKLEGGFQRRRRDFENPGNLVDSILSGTSDSSTTSNEEQTSSDSSDNTNNDQDEATPGNHDSSVPRPELAPAAKECPDGCPLHAFVIPDFSFRGLHIPDLYRGFTRRGRELFSENKGLYARDRGIASLD